MKKSMFVTMAVLASLSVSSAFAAGKSAESKKAPTAICFETADTTKSAFESTELKIMIVNINGLRLLSSKVEEVSKDSGPFQSAIKTYAQIGDSSDETLIRIQYTNGQPSRLLLNSDQELSLKFSGEQTVVQGTACFDISE